MAKMAQIRKVSFKGQLEKVMKAQKLETAWGHIHGKDLRGKRIPENIQRKLSDDPKVIDRLKLLSRMAFEQLQAEAKKGPKKKMKA